jgi:hypothetical protein
MLDMRDHSVAPWCPSKLRAPVTPYTRPCAAPADDPQTVSRSHVFNGGHCSTWNRLVVEGGGELDVAGEKLGDAVLDLACHA